MRATHSAYLRAVKRAGSPAGAHTPSRTDDGEEAARRLVRELDGAGSRADIDRILREYGLRRLREKKGGVA